MLHHRPFSFLVSLTALSTASCISIYPNAGHAQPAYAQAPGAPAPGAEPGAVEEAAPPEVAPPGDMATETEAAPPQAPMPHHPPGHGQGPMMDPAHMVAMKKIVARMADDRTDHQKAVGRWGVEVRRMATLNRSGKSDPRCDDPATPGAVEPCELDINSIGVRRWLSPRYGWSAALALAAGGGKTTGSGSWDTHLGIGPQVGANFVLADSKHVVVSAMPQLGFLAFLPSGSGSKTYLLDVRAMVEAEIHLGFIDLPQLSVGTSAGLLFNYTKKTTPGAGSDKDKAGGADGAPFSSWDVGLTGPRSLWGLVNDVFVRFYF